MTCGKDTPSLWAVNRVYWLSPISGFFASSASSVLKRVLGKRMKIFDLQKTNPDWTELLFFSSLFSFVTFITCPVCTPPVCSPGGWPARTHHQPACRANWATCRDTGVYTCQMVAMNEGQTQTLTETVLGSLQIFSHLCRKASKRRRYANPALLTRRFSIRPRYFTWCLTRTSSNFPAHETHLIIYTSFSHCPHFKQPLSSNFCCCSSDFVSLVMKNLSIRPALCHLLVRPNITSDTIQKIVLNIFIAPHTQHVIWTDLCIDNILKCYVTTNVWFFFHHIPFSVLYRPNLTCTMLQHWPETMKQTSKTSVSVNNRYQLASRRWVWCSVRRRVL